MRARDVIRWAWFWAGEIAGVVSLGFLAYVGLFLAHLLEAAP